VFPERTYFIEKGQICRSSTQQHGEGSGKLVFLVMEAVKGNAVTPVKTPQQRDEVNFCCQNLAYIFNHLTEKAKNEPGHSLVAVYLLDMN
jgi:hypothetical protein